MPKKNFKDNPALAFIQPQHETQEDTHAVTQDVTPSTKEENTQDITHDEAHEATQPTERRDYIRTQGRKGHKKPRINLAFDSEAFLDKIRIRAEREGKSITQFVNDAVAYYMDNTKGGGRK